MAGNSDKKVAEISAYCAFKDDRDRRLALMSRDVRQVAIALIVVLGLQFVPLHGVRAVLALLGWSG